MKKDIRSLSEDQLCDFFVNNGYESFRGKQVYNWLWNKSVNSFEKMTNLSLPLRKTLGDNFVINNLLVDKIQKSKDGTIKNAVRLFDGFVVESVLIPSNKRSTACV